MPQVVKSCCQTDDVNCEPLSVVISSGMPKEAIMPWVKASMTEEVVMSTMGIAIGHLVNRSTAVSKYRKPFERGNVSISTFQCWNRLGGTEKSPIGGTVLRVTFARWHC